MVLHEVLAVGGFGFEHAGAGADELAEVDGLDFREEEGDVGAYGPWLVYGHYFHD